MDKYRHYLLEVGKPYTGSIQNVYSMAHDAVASWSNERDMTLAEYEAYHGRRFRVLSAEQFAKLESEYEASLCDGPEEITEAQWDWFLECLPPLGWQMVQGIEIFRMSEHLRGDVTQWCARLGERYCKMHDRASMKPDRIAARARQFFDNN